jgi:hypothetical protein
LASVSRLRWMRASYRNFCISPCCVVRTHVVQGYLMKTRREHILNFYIYNMHENIYKGTGVEAWPVPSVSH